MIREVLRIDNTSLLSEALNYLRNLTDSKVLSSPCCYTVEELNKQLDQAEQEACLGLGYEHDDLKKMRPQWKLG